MMRGYLVDGDKDTVERKHEVPLGDFHRHVETELEVLRKVENGDDFSLSSMWIEELRTLAREAASQLDPQKLYENPNAMDLKMNNRYTNVLPYANKRVMLKQKGHDLTTNYINASPISALLTGAQRGYIGAQAPIPSTFPDWWRMIWEQQCDIVLMLTNTIESERLKAHKYWPDVGGCTVYGDVKVTAKTSSEDGDLFCRTYTISNVAEPKVPERSVTHIQFVGWPDHGVPKSLDTFVNLFTTYRAIRDHAPAPGPVLVHCSAGIGRTGTFIALDQLLDNLQADRVKDGKTSPSVNVYAITKHMREQRPGMIQTKEQYVFCSVFLDHCLHNKVLGLSYSGDTKPAAPRVSMSISTPAAVTPRVSCSNGTTSPTPRVSMSTSSACSSASSCPPAPPSPCSNSASAPPPSSNHSHTFLTPSSSHTASPTLTSSPLSRASSSGSSPARSRAFSSGGAKK